MLTRLRSWMLSCVSASINGASIGMFFRRPVGAYAPIAAEQTASVTASQLETHVLSVSGCTIGASWQHPCDCDDQLMMERSDRVGNVALGPDWHWRWGRTPPEWQSF